MHKAVRVVRRDSSRTESRTAEVAPNVDQTQRVGSTFRRRRRGRSVKGRRSIKQRPGHLQVPEDLAVPACQVASLVLAFPVHTLPARPKLMQGRGRSKCKLIGAQRMSGETNGSVARTIGGTIGVTTAGTTGVPTDGTTGATTDEMTGGTTDGTTGATTDEMTGGTTDGTTGATTDEMTGGTDAMIDDHMTAGTAGSATAAASQTRGSATTKGGDTVMATGEGRGREIITTSAMVLGK